MAPDGYTIGLTNLPNLFQFYLDPERKAAFNRASFQLLATNNDEPACLIVKADSAFRSTKDVIRGDHEKARHDQSRNQRT